MRDIVIRGDYVKTLITIVIPLILVAIIAVQWFYPHCAACESCGTSANEEAAKESNGSGTEDNSVTVIKAEGEEDQESGQTTATANTNGGSSETTSDENTTTASTNTSSSSSSSSSSGTLPITGQITLTVDDVDTSNKGTWGRVTKIKYTIKNQKQTFTPKIVAHGYDPTYDEELKDYIEGEVILPELLAGESITKTMDVSITFNNINTTKTVKLELFDADGSSTTAIKSATKDFKIE